MFFTIMIFPIVLSTLITLPVVEMCIGMIPPEDVSVGTISATQASPVTTTQCTASSCPSTTTAVRGTPVMVSTVTPAPGTITTVPVPGVTMAPGSLCTKCDIAAIAPVMEANTVFENTNTVGPDGCTQTNAICRRTDDQVCTGVILSATNAAGTSPISSAMKANQVTGLLTCQADGTYSSGSVTGITKLMCNFDTCVPACATCDIEAARPLMDPPNTFFLILDRTPAGQTCKVYQVLCNYNGLSCSSIILYATIRPASDDIENKIVEVNDVEMLAANIACGTDGTLNFMGTVTPIVRFRCEYTNCMM